MRHTCFAAAVLLSSLACLPTMAATSASSSSTAPAAPRDAEAQADDCDALPQQLMNACYAEQMRRSQRLLDALLAELRAKLEPNEREGLDEVQALWLKYHQAHCTWQVSSFEGGPSSRPFMQTASRSTPGSGSRS